MLFPSVYHLFRLIRNQWLSPSEIEEIQRSKLRAIIRHSYENVDYYRQLFDSVGVKPEDIRDKNDLLRIPVTTKAQLQKQPIGKITAKGINLSKCVHAKTSGSTGIPLDIIMSREDARFRAAVSMRGLLAIGYRLKDKKANISIPVKGPCDHWYQYLGIGRQKHISVFDTADEQLRQLKSMKPDIIQGLPSGIGVIAEKIKKEKTKGICPRMVISGAEILTQRARETIDSTFGVRVIDTYNSWEFGSIAWECGRHAGYHINTDSLVVEFINNGKPVLPGERGEIVITGLGAYAMPFIRYNIADIGIPGDKQCTCGRGLPLLKKIEGRTDDLIRLSGERVVSPFTITCALRFISGIAQFRLIQESENECLLQVAEGKDFCRETIVKVREELKKVLGAKVHLKIQILDEIPRDPSGKLRSVISKVKF